MESLRIAYVALFGAAALLCIALIPRCRVVSESDTRRALAGLLAITGVWAGLTTLQVLADTYPVKLRLYILGLAVGLAAVIAWLAFCSAYAGRTLHRTTTIQVATLAIYLLVVGLKFTNPLHGQYFAASLTPVPFPHLMIDRLALDWLITSGAYFAAGYGFLLLYDALSETEYSTASLWAVFALAALPVLPAVLTTVGVGGLLNLNYEPIGVALFATGALYFTEEKFNGVGQYGYASVVDDLGEGVVVIDTEGRIQRANRTAIEAFPKLEGAVGRRAADTVPELTGSRDQRVVTVDEDEWYFVRQSVPLRVGNTRVGTAVVLTDVSEIEQKRRELERQNQQLDDFAAAIDHELRNTLGIATGYTDLARTQLDDPAAVDESLEVVAETLERMRGITEDLATLARYGQTVSRTTPCDIGTLARRAWGDVVGPDSNGSLRIGRENTVRANETRLTELFEAAFEFAVTEGATQVAVESDGDTLVVTMDCSPIPADRVDEALAYDAAVPSAEAGMLLANVRTLATVHGWTVAFDPDADEVRLLISGIERSSPPADSDG